MFDKIKEYFSEEQKEDRRIKELEKLEHERELMEAKLEVEMQKSEVSGIKNQIKDEKRKRLKQSLSPVMKVLDGISNVGVGMVKESQGRRKVKGNDSMLSKSHPMADSLHSNPTQLGKEIHTEKKRTLKDDELVDITKRKRSLADDIHGE